MAFTSQEFLGEERQDLRLGILASVIANVNRGKDQAPYKALDFMPRFWGQAAETMTASEKALAIFGAIKAQQEENHGRP